MVKELKTDYFSWIKVGKCCCGSGEFEFISTDRTGILVNVESKGKVYIKDFWIPSRVCNNPLCKWSKIKDDIEPLNLVSTKEAWELLEK